MSRSTGLTFFALFVLCCMSIIVPPLVVMVLPRYLPVEEAIILEEYGITLEQRLRILLRKPLQEIRNNNWIRAIINNNN